MKYQANLQTVIEHVVLIMIASRSILRSLAPLRQALLEVGKSSSYSLRARTIMRNIAIARVKLMVAKRYQVNRVELSAARR